MLNSGNVQSERSLPELIKLGTTKVIDAPDTNSRPSGKKFTLISSKSDARGVMLWLITLRGPTSKLHCQPLPLGMQLNIQKHPYTDTL